MILWLSNFDYVLVSLLLRDSELSIFELWTNQYIRGRILGCWIDISHNFLTFYRTNWLIDKIINRIINSSGALLSYFHSPESQSFWCAANKTVRSVPSFHWLPSWSPLFGVLPDRPCAVAGCLCRCLHVTYAAPHLSSHISASASINLLPAQQPANQPVQACC